MRNKLALLSLLMYSMVPATAQVSIGIGVPNVSIGINLPLYPELVPIPGYPVYYAPRLDLNYFFYDGMYWVYQEDNWYASSWYNGPWGLVDPVVVPLFILRIPVRYYRQPPAYFRGWQSDAPPRWRQHWGKPWAQRRGDWDRWDHRAAPAPAPLPSYQRQYSGDRYPRVEQQQELRNRIYPYQPSDPVVRQHYRAQQERPNVMPGRIAPPRGGPPGQRQEQPLEQGEPQRQQPPPESRRGTHGDHENDRGQAEDRRRDRDR